MIMLRMNQGMMRQSVGANLVGLIVLSLIANISGCGRDESVVVVEGAVRYAGKRVMNGDIRFYPIEGTQGATAGAPIVDGHYQAVNKGGVPVGKHRIVIRAFVLEDVGPVSGQTTEGDLLSTVSPDRNAKTQMPVYVVEGRKQFIPGKYNVKSELTAEVTGDTNPHTINFDLPEVET
jgi:hypothetical protein